MLSNSLVRSHMSWGPHCETRFVCGFGIVASVEKYAYPIELVSYKTWYILFSSSCADEGLFRQISAAKDLVQLFTSV